MLWGTHIATVAWDPERQFASVRYDHDFLRSQIEVAPFHMPLSDEIYSFPELARLSFKGLPGLLADSLPDKFGSALIEQWIQRQGKNVADFSPVDHLCYVGRRGMGALEFVPTLGKTKNKAEELEIASLVRLANQALSEKGLLDTALDDEEAVEQIIRVGTSAGGARAKALILWNPDNNQVYSGQLDPMQGFEYWLMKFDGVANSGDKEGADPQGYGLIEYAYHQLAIKVGIQMSPCRLLHEQGRSHFMTKRFDRDDQGHKLHMQSLCALKHYDFNMAGAYSYEQALQCCYDLKLSKNEVRELFRRMCFNVILRNQDDHTKNIAFLMDMRGRWTLSPAYDVTYAYNPNGAWTSQHQMSINGKRRDIQRADLLAVAKRMRIGKPNAVIDQVIDAAKQWPSVADEVGIVEDIIVAIQKTFRDFD